MVVPAAASAGVPGLGYGQPDPGPVR